MAEDFEDLPTHLSTRRSVSKERISNHHKYDREFYAGIEHIIKGSVGQHWDKVYAKMVEKLGDRRKEHDFRNTIERWVELNAKVVNKPDGTKEYLQQKGEYIFAAYFVHPVSRVLTVTPERHTRYENYNYYPHGNAPKTIENRHRTINNRHYHSVNDVWYELTLKPFPPYDPVTYKKSPDVEFKDSFMVLLNKMERKSRLQKIQEETGVVPNPEHYHIPDIYTFAQDRTTAEKLYKTAAYCISYRQMGKKEIQRIFGKQTENQLPNLVRRK